MHPPAAGPRVHGPMLTDLYQLTMAYGDWKTGAARKEAVFHLFFRRHPEGTVVFPFEPLVRITGPILQAQLLETPLLNILNFQTLIATKAARICEAAQGDPVLEFGLRRAQGADGGLAASRAADVGGCAGTSNVLAGIRLDSGDLAFLSIEAHRMLDEAGFPDTVIVASNELDEHVITRLTALMTQARGRKAS